MRVSTDIGGTFTDLVAINKDGSIVFEKSNTTPADFEQGVIDVLKKSSVDFKEIESFVHGTTVIINALTERKGAKTALITTKGFRDVIEIARCNRPDLFNIYFKKPSLFVERYLRCEVSERMNYKGEVVEPVCKEDVKKAVEYLKKEDVKAIAICFLHSYANNSHELEVAKYIRELWGDIYVTCSFEITREWREYERSTTTVLNGYVMPIAAEYIDKLEQKLEENKISALKYIMQSNGGSASFNFAKKTPINMIESGPVAGVFGSALLGKLLGFKNVISLDVGGTTAKCSLITNNEVTVVTDYRIERNERNAGYPIMVPVVDIVEIGNGGGSIAWVDDIGALKVGPKSAGAVPGPIAYGLSGEDPTTTDACLITGKLSAENFEMKVDLDNIKNQLIEKIGKYFNMTYEDAAVSIIKVAESNMLNALKIISVRKGHDPREFALIAFGGGGPMHACALAKELNIKKVVVPVGASVFSAWGMMMTDLRHDYLKTHICRTLDISIDDVNRIWGELRDEAEKQYADENVKRDDIIFSYTADMRYMGQEHTVKVSIPAPPWTDEIKNEIIKRFHDIHEKNYTFKLETTPTEIVNFHLTSFGKIEKPVINEIQVNKCDILETIKEVRPVYFPQDGFIDTKVYKRDKLWPGIELKGPGIVEEHSVSTVFFKGDKLTVDKYGNLIIDLEVE